MLTIHGSLSEGLARPVQAAFPRFQLPKPFFSHVDALWRNFPCGFCTCMHAHVGTLPHGLHMWTLGPVWAISAVTTLIASFQTSVFYTWTPFGRNFPWGFVHLWTPTWARYLMVYICGRWTPFGFFPLWQASKSLFFYMWTPCGRNFFLGICTSVHAHVGTSPHGLHMWTLDPVWAFSAVATRICKKQASKSLFFTCGRRVGATFPGDLYICGRPRGHFTSCFTMWTLDPVWALQCY